MDRETAIDLMIEVEKLSTQLNVIINKVLAVTPEESKKELNVHIPHMIFAVHKHLFEPILEYFPDRDTHP